MSSSAPRGVTPLELSADAEPSAVGAARRSLRRWLVVALDAAADHAGVSDDHVADLTDDLVLAASEALENVVDHAFAGAGRTGTMTVRAEVTDGVVTVVVADDGRWREPSTGPSSRGRGLAMMTTLAEADVQRGPSGTTVRLRRSLRTPSVAQA